MFSPPQTFPCVRAHLGEAENVLQGGCSGVKNETFHSPERVVMVTIKDVAREAAVSVGTASQALRDSPAVREATRRRVLAVSKRLRYQPSALARGLVTRRTHTVGLLISDIANPFFIRAVRAVEDVAQENGYNVI